MQCPWLSCVAWGLRRRNVRPPAAATCSVIWLLLWGQRACPNHGLISTPVKRVPDASVPKIDLFFKSWHFQHLTSSQSLTFYFLGLQLWGRVGGRSGECCFHGLRFLKGHGEVSEPCTITSLIKTAFSTQPSYAIWKTLHFLGIILFFHCFIIIS